MANELRISAYFTFAFGKCVKKNSKIQYYKIIIYKFYIIIIIIFIIINKYNKWINKKSIMIKYKRFLVLQEYLKYVKIKIL